MKRKFLALVFTVVGLTLVGCYRAAEQSETDSHFLGETDTASGTASSTQTDTGTATAPATDTGTDTDGPTHQEPITFRVTNHRNAPIYLDYISPRTFERELPSTEREQVNFFDPWCSVECESAGRFEGSCCIDCDYMEAVWIIEPQTSLAFEWDGQVRNWLTEPCGGECECYSAQNPLAGRYWYGVSAALEVECYDECSPDESGVIWGASRGQASMFTEIGFELPWKGEAMEIVFEEDGK